MHMPPTSSVEPFSLKSTTGPWVVVTTLSDPTLVSQLTVFGATGGVIRHVDAANMMTENDLFRSLLTALAFRRISAINWDAMVDCLDDLHGDGTGIEMWLSSSTMRKCCCAPISATFHFSALSGGGARQLVG